eukprot:snap_masked-scaffold_12-processed-gene-11.63-mRNA-1 protein AED:1.00 eAED:1.00 QI:0/-1/0/0/-1/1/1/0/84
MPQLSTPSRNVRLAVNNNTVPRFNYHLQQAAQENIQRYQSPQRDPYRALDAIVRRFEGINGQVLNQEKAQIYIYICSDGFMAAC